MWANPVLLKSTILGEQKYNFNILRNALLMICYMLVFGKRGPSFSYDNWTGDTDIAGEA